MSLLNWTRQGSMVVTCEKPIFHLVWARAGAQPVGRWMAKDAPAAATGRIRKLRRFMDSSSLLGCLFDFRRPQLGGRSSGFRNWAAQPPPASEEIAEVAFLHQYGHHDDEALEHELQVGIDVVQLQDVGKET